MIRNVKMSNLRNVCDAGEQRTTLIDIKDVQCRQEKKREESLNEIIYTRGGVASATKRFSSWLETLLYQESFGR